MNRSYVGELQWQLDRLVDSIGSFIRSPRVYIIPLECPVMEFIDRCIDIKGHTSACYHLVCDSIPVCSGHGPNFQSLYIKLNFDYYFL